MCKYEFLSVELLGSLDVVEEPGIAWPLIILSIDECAHMGLLNVELLLLRHVLESLQEHSKGDAIADLIYCVEGSLHWVQVLVGSIRKSFFEEDVLGDLVVSIVANFNSREALQPCLPQCLEHPLCWSEQGICVHSQLHRSWRWLEQLRSLRVNLDPHEKIKVVWF